MGKALFKTEAQNKSKLQRILLLERGHLAPLTQGTPVSLASPLCVPLTQHRACDTTNPSTQEGQEKKREDEQNDEIQVLHDSSGHRPNFTFHVFCCQDKDKIQKKEVSFLVPLISA